MAFQSKNSGYSGNKGGYESYGGKGGSGGSKGSDSEKKGKNPKRSVNVFAPYNFVPFPKKPAYIKDESEIIGHNEMASQAEDGEELYSGEISYTLQAMTPVFVDDGTEAHRFCRNAAGEYMIPGSTMRGLIRSHAMVLGLGNVRDEIEDYSLMYRDIANGLDKEQYKTILGADTVSFTNSNGKNYTLSVLKNVRAGYIEKKENGKYVIYKTELDEKDPPIHSQLGVMNYYVLSERHIIEHYLSRKNKYKSNPDSFPYSFLIPFIENEKMNETKKFDKISYEKRINGEVVEIVKYKGTPNKSYIPYHKRVAYSLSGFKDVNSVKSPEYADTNQRFKRGELVSTGYMQEKKAIYVIPDIDHSGENGKPRIAVELSDQDVRNFQIDYNRRKNSIALNRNNPNRKSENKTKEYKDFFNLPEDIGEKGRKPVFYIKLNNKQDERYFFGFTPRLRLFYDHSVSKGINSAHDEEKPDLIKAIFGYTSDGRSSVKGADARKTRVSFSDAVQFAGIPDGVASSKSSELEERCLTLSEPRPNNYFNYLVQEKNEKNKSYNSKDFSLRGAKQYWLHSEALAGVKPEKQNEKMDSRLNPLDKGSCFKGTIRFKNLRKYELGLLLWSIKLEENSWMNLGKGKAYGYGAMKLTDLRVRSVEFSKAYGVSNAATGTSTIFGNLYKDLNIAELINYYKFFIKKHIGGRSIDQESLIQDFMAMKDSTRIPEQQLTGYMSLDEFGEQKRSKTPLPKISEVAREKKSSAPGLQQGANAQKGAKIQEVLFIAGYPLSDSQRKKLEEMSLLPVRAVKEWPDEGIVTQYARKYCCIALPHEVKKTNCINICKRFCNHVYKATKKPGEKVDSGWEILK